jgi:hypothetical protein
VAIVALQDQLFNDVTPAKDKTALTVLAFFMASWEAPMKLCFSVPPIILFPKYP